MEILGQKELKEQSIGELATQAHDLIHEIFSVLNRKGISEMEFFKEKYSELGVGLKILMCAEGTVDYIDFSSFEEEYRGYMQEIINILREKRLTISIDEENFDPEVLTAAQNLGDLQKLLSEIQKKSVQRKLELGKIAHEEAVQRELAKIPTPERIIHDLRLQLFAAGLLLAGAAAAAGVIYFKSESEIKSKSAEIQQLINENHKLKKELGECKGVPPSIIKPADK